jgi:NADPH:quinone reductase-like Zn-dependent oxidoreductase
MLGSWLIGKRVAFNKSFEQYHFKMGGSMADYIVTDDRHCIPLADDVTMEQGASYFVNPLTALGMVDRVKEIGAKSVIVTAAASQIGRMII